MATLNEMTQIEVEEKLDALQLALAQQRQQQERTQEAVKTVRAKWEQENAALLEEERQITSVVEQAETNARDLMVRYHTLTGLKSYKGAFEVRMTPTPEYDPTILKAWLLGLIDKTMTLDSGAVKTFLKDNAEGHMVLVTAPALIVQKPMPAILSKGLLKPETTPEPVEPVTVKSEGNDMPYTPSTDEIKAVVASTSAAVAKTVKEQSAPVAKSVHLSEIPF